MPDFSVAGEGILDLAVARAILESCGHTIFREFDRKGKHNLDLAIPGFARSSAQFYWLILRDLDQEENCAPTMLSRLRPAHADKFKFCLRIAVNAIESWLLADMEGIARYLNVKQADVPLFPDALPNPKTAMVNLVRSSRSREIREGIAPRQGSGAKVGPEYNQRLIGYVYEEWNQTRAMPRSDSLRRAINRLRTL